MKILKNTRKAAMVLGCYVALSALVIIYDMAEGASLNSGHGFRVSFDLVGASREPGQVLGEIVGESLVVLMAWRIWRGGRLAWRILVAVNSLAVLMTFIAFLSNRNIYLGGLLALCCAGLGLIVSPPVRGRAGRADFA